MIRKVLSILIFLTVTLSWCAGLEAGDEAETFVNPRLSGEFVFSKDYIGQGWLLLDFFATWCGPCKEELPELEQLHREFKDRGLTVFVFATDEKGADVVKPFFGENPTPLAVLLDRYMVTADRYGVNAVPVVFLINPEGDIVLRGDGYSPETIEEIRSILSENCGDGP